MTISWNSLEGTALADFQLQNLLFEKGDRACFLARRPDGSRPPGWLWLRLTGGDADVASLQQWQATAGLSHPNLVQVWEAGRTGREDAPMVYLLTEPAVENLGAVLRQRPLNQVEARETLLSVVKPLSYLHAQGLVHGRVEPAAILAVGEDIKLAVDSIAPLAEAGGGGLSRADDLRALGRAIHAMFTQNPEPDEARLYAVPQPFRDIIRGCCGMANETWSAERVLAALEWEHPKPAARAAEIPAPEPEPQPEPQQLPPPPPPARRRRIPAWVVVSAVAGAALVFAALVKKPQPAIPPAAVPPPSAGEAHAPAASPRSTPEPAPPLPSALGPPAAQPAPPASDLASSHVWRVVTYTYSTAEGAARMVREINRRWPQLHAEPFFPKGSAPPYYVALGGRMTRNEARRLRQRAVSVGLPRDTFVRNFRE